MAGRVLTKEDFEGGDSKDKKDTSDAVRIVPGDTKFDQDGNIIEEPEGKETPPEEKIGDEESQPKPSNKKEDFKPKHKTWEETESARVILERDFTTKSMENAELRKKLATYEKPPEKKEPIIDDQIEEINNSALTELKSFQWEYGVDGKPTKESIEKYDKFYFKVDGKRQRQIARLEYDERDKKRSAENEVSNKLYKKSTEAGLKTDDELQLVGFEYSKTDSSLGIDERISEAVKNAQAMVGRFREGYKKNAELDKKEKDNLKVLGRGSSRSGKETGGEKETKPSTMSQDLANIHEQRRLKTEDLR